MEKLTGKFFLVWSAFQLFFGARYLWEKILYPKQAHCFIVHDHYKYCPIICFKKKYFPVSLESYFLICIRISFLILLLRGLKAIFLGLRCGCFKTQLEIVFVWKSPCNIWQNVGGHGTFRKWLKTQIFFSKTAAQRIFLSKPI